MKKALLLLFFLGCSYGAPMLPQPPLDASVDAATTPQEPLQDAETKDVYHGGYGEAPEPERDEHRLWEAGVDNRPPTCACFVYPTREGPWLCFVEMCSLECSSPGETGSKFCIFVGD